MKLLSRSIYVGPNLYSKTPSIRLEISPPSKKFSDFPRELHRFLKDLAGWQSESWADGAEDFPGLLARLAIEFQRQSGSRVEASRVVEGQECVHVVFGYDDEDTGLDAGYLAFDIIDHLLNGEDAGRSLKQIKSDYEDFLFYAERRALGPSTLSLIQEAESRDIPWVRLNEESLVQFGQGRYQKRIEATVTSQTSLIAADIASNKSLTNRLLKDLGLPVPKQQLIRRFRSAKRIADRMGYPLVVKPKDGNHGRGITIGVQDVDELETAYDLAREHGEEIILESVLEGDDHRLLVVDGQLIAAARRVAAHVVGDGKQSIRKLIEEVNLDPRRGIGHEKVLTRIEINQVLENFLAKRGQKLEDVPEEGKVISLRNNANISSGGTAIDVTNEVHPDIRLMAERAIKAIGLDIGGVDFLCNDISKSYNNPANKGCGICEINAGPGFRMHVAPNKGKPRNVAKAVIDMLFPEGSQSRIPIAALTGTNGKTTTARMLAHIMRMAGFHVGLTTTDAVYINGKLSVKGDMTGPMAANVVLRDPNVDMAVLETARGGIARAGLGYDRCDVGAVLNVASDHLGLRGINTLEELAEVKRLIVEVAKDSVVLNADDPLCMGMLPHLSAKRVCYVSMNPENPIILKQKEEEGLVVLLEEDDFGEYIVLYDKGRRIVLTRPRLIPATLEGKAVHNTQNAMFALAMAYCLGTSLDDISQGLRTFDCSFYQTPGRTNIFDEHPFKVILDYGHNAAAVKMMVALVQRMNARGKTWVLLTGPGDRRDQDLKALAEEVAGHFDHYVCHDEDDRRKREPREVSLLMQNALFGKEVPEDKVEIIEKEEDAVESVLSRAKPGDLVLIFAENITRTWKQIIYFKPELDD